MNVALPPIQRDLGGGLAAQQWIVDAYLLTLGSLILVGGSLGDIFGEVRMFRLGVACSASRRCSARVAPNVEDADRLPRHPGHRRRAPDAGVARGDHVDVLGRRARRGDRHVDRVERDLDRRRAAARRLADRRLELARDLLPERADRDRDARDLATRLPHHETRRERRARRLRRAARSAWSGSARSSSASSSSRGSAGTSRSSRSLARRRRCARRVRLLGARVRRSRCCRCASSACATSASRTSRRSPSTAASRRWSSSSTSSSSRSPATRRSAPGLATLPVTIVMFVLSRYAGRFSMRFGPRLFMARGPADRRRAR